MSDITLTAIDRPGQGPIGGSVEELFIPVAANQVLLSYEDTVQLEKVLETKTAPAGAESVQFDYIGNSSTRFREVGKSILSGSSDALNTTPSGGGANPFMTPINHGRRKVYLDRPLMGGPHFIDDFEGFLSTLRNGGEMEILSKIGYAIARDIEIFGFSYLAKGAAPVASGGIDWNTFGPNMEIPAEFRPTAPGDNWVVDVNSDTDGSALLDGLRQVKEYWDQQNVPQRKRFAFVDPVRYNLLVQNQDLLNRDLGNSANGIFSDGTVFRAWGMELVMTNLIGDNVTSGATTNPGIRNVQGYDFNASNLTALCVQGEAAVKARNSGVTLMTKDYGFEYGGTAMVGEMAHGYEILRPLCLGAVATA